MGHAAPLKIYRDKSMGNLNTLALPAKVSHFCVVTNVGELQQAIEFANSEGLQIIPLGAGSNVVLTVNLDALVVSINFQGIENVDSNEAGDYVDIKFSAGENWHQSVIHSLNNGWYGLENLSLIPGNIGAAAIQNIGAYGAELSDTLVSVGVFNIESYACSQLSREECQFSYRNSIFKQSLKDKCIITDITLRLSRKAKLNIEYPALLEYFNSHNLSPTARNVSRAVCDLRRCKLPDYKMLPNVGSFFTNPVLSIHEFEKLKGLQRYRHIDIPFYRNLDGMIKVPAGWLIDNLGFRGARQGSAGVHEKQALVLVNHRDGPQDDWARDIMLLATQIRDTVKSQCLIQLEIEPRVYGPL
ncbi:UDP-N-acetylmuramate dehydrogenase [Porticoccaceae bacterium]|nr:UDP-N-acetylmuramate dehydrogenase [Porticoccaceae bacterium]MDB2343538.1 UDP-N-acetylmuramate dehydrogenase [Porticoccaceae bacterium]